eukprot:7810848-Alexandrium_andersonii.AAC.1
MALEGARNREGLFSATSFDLFKAFDRLDRGLVVQLMALAGWPMGVLRAYSGFMQELRVRSAF